jgi:molybdate transport system substrate-binding protein
MALRRFFLSEVVAALAFFFLVGAVFAKPAVAKEPPAIAAAADLQFALEDIARLFAEQTGQQVQLTFGSSGNFVRQIEQGAPFQMFLSADEAYVFRLADKGLTRDRGEVYAIGRVVIFAPHDSSLKVDEYLSGLHEALAAGRIQRFAIANPEHAPYGRAAREALKSRGLWEAVQPFLVLGENVAQAAQFATTGNSQGGIIAYSLVLSPVMRPLGRWALLPENRREPLRQRMVLLANAGDTAGRFFAHMRQPAARDILRRYGLALPGE